jgi:hypothetical protein
MMMWSLIVLVVASSNGTHTQLQAIDFPSKAQCEAAAPNVQAFSERHWIIVKAICVDRNK